MESSYEDQSIHAEDWTHIMEPHVEILKRIRERRRRKIIIKYLSFSLWFLFGVWVTLILSGCGTGEGDGDPCLICYERTDYLGNPETVCREPIIEPYECAIR